MEYRWNKRKNFANDIRIYRNGLQVDSGKICDINNEGMAFKSDHLCFIKNIKLDIEFCLDSSKYFGNYRLPVWVVHTSKMKAGALFIFSNTDEIREVCFLVDSIEELAVA